MKIYTEIHHTVYVGDTSITAVVFEDGQLSHIDINSVNNDNKGRIFIDNLLYIERIGANKKDLKQKLIQEGLLEKGITKTIKKLTKKYEKFK